jgi:dipeptidyl aminopeptidase/acylaminoacyl peptidase
MRHVLLALLAIPVALAGDVPREVGNLVFDGIPPIDPAIAERALPYSNVRAATLLDWRPDGTGLAIATRFGETNQVHEVLAPGGDRRQLTFFGDPVASAAYDPAAPDTGLYVQTDRGGGEFYQYGWFDRTTNAVTSLTAEGSRNTGLLVAPAGGRVAFVSTERNRTDFDLYLVDRHDPSTRRRVLELAGEWSPVDWSPDGTRLTLSHFVSETESTLHVWNAVTGESVQVAGAPGVSVGGGVFGADGDSVFFTSDEGADVKSLRRLRLSTGVVDVVSPASSAWDVERVMASEDGRVLAWTVNAGGVSTLSLASSSHPDHERVVTALPGGVVGALAFSRDGARLAVTVSTPRASSDVYVVDVRKPDRVVRWTTSELGGLDPAGFVEPREVRFPSFDGRQIPSWYYPAPGPGPHPVIIAIHGGPEGQSRIGFNAGFQYWIDTLGAAVLAPNVRGSTGYGRAYTLLDNAALRLDSVRDIGALLDWVRAQPELDSRRVAVMGASYGGFMTLASLVSHGDRLRCGIDTVGISNFVTFLENTESYRRDLRRAEYGDERDPKMRAYLESISPRTHAAEIHVPLLVVQGANDPRVPLSEAEGMVREVRANGGEAWYLLAKDEGHGFRRKSNREAQLAVSTVFLERCLR